MNDFTFMKKMNEEDAYLFKRCIRKMLDTTFIVADKDEKLYDFISSESNQYDVNTYLADGAGTGQGAESHRQTERSGKTECSQLLRELTITRNGILICYET